MGYFILLHPVLVCLVVVVNVIAAVHLKYFIEILIYCRLSVTVIFLYFYSTSSR